MSLISIPYIFEDGEVITAAKLNSNFSAVATFVNTTKLSGVNFRPQSGIPLGQRESKCFDMASSVSIRCITQNPATTKTYTGVWAYPHYTSVAPDQDQSLQASNQFDVHSIDGVYLTSANVAGGDTITVAPYYVYPHVTSYSAATTLSLGTTANTLQSVTYSGATALVGIASLRVDLTIVTAAGGSARTLGNVLITVHIKSFHRK